MTLRVAAAAPFLGGYKTLNFGQCFRSLTTRQLHYDAVRSDFWRTARTVSRNTRSHRPPPPPPPPQTMMRLSSSSSFTCRSLGTQAVSVRTSFLTVATRGCRNVKKYVPNTRQWSSSSSSSSKTTNGSVVNDVKTAASSPKNDAAAAATATTTAKSVPLESQQLQPPTTFLQRFLGPKEMPKRYTFAWYREMLLICTVFGITGSSTMLLVRPAVKDLLGIDGSFRDGPWSYRISSVVIMSPIYATLLVLVGTVFGRHAYFRQFSVKIFSRFGIPPEVIDQNYHLHQKTFRKW